MDDYKRYGEEWKTEISKRTKARIIDLAAKIGESIEKLEAEKDCLICKVKNLEDSLADAEALAGDIKADCTRLEQENKKLKDAVAEGRVAGLKEALELVRKYEGCCRLAGDSGQTTGAMYSALRIEEALKALEV